MSFEFYRFRRLRLERHDSVRYSESEEGDDFESRVAYTNTVVDLKLEEDAF